MSDMKSNIRDIASSNDVLVMLRGWLSASPVERDYLSRHMGRLGIHGVTSGNICSRIHFAKLSKALDGISGMRYLIHSSMMHKIVPGSMGWGCEND